MNQLRFNTNVYKVTQKIMIKSHAETGGKINDDHRRKN